jgi:Holliday junction resolvasome RuvABC endonuclease subunit
LRVERRSERSGRSNDGFVLGVDPSYSGFGMCFYFPDGKYSTFHASFPPDKSTGVDRLVDIESWLTGVLGTVGEHIRHVCLEGYAYGRKNGREEAGELGAVVKLALRQLGVPVGYPTIVSPPEVKKYATGSGKAEKSDIKLAVYRKWGAEFRNDNEADSFVLAKMAAAIAYREPQLEYERALTDKLRRHTEWVER